MCVLNKMLIKWYHEVRSKTVALIESVLWLHRLKRFIRTTYVSLILYDFFRTNTELFKIIP